MRVPANRNNVRWASAFAPGPSDSDLSGFSDAAEHLLVFRELPGWLMHQKQLSTTDAVDSLFEQILLVAPAQDERTRWIQIIDAAADRNSAIEDLAETLLLRTNDPRSVLHLHMSFLESTPTKGQLDELVGTYEAMRSGTDLTKKEALVLTVRNWLYDQQEAPIEFTEADFRSILFLNLIFGTSYE